MNKKYFRMFACCFLVKGARRSLIADVQRDTFYLIPNSLYAILTEDKDKSLSFILNKYGQDNQDIIQEYFDFLTENEYIFWCEEEELSLFPDISFAWEMPNRITNAIVDIDQNTVHNFENIFRQLDVLGCKHVQIRSYCELPMSTLENLLKSLEGLRIISVYLLTKATNSYNNERLKSLFNSYQRLQQLVFHSVEVIEANEQSELSKYPIIHTRQRITDQSHCGIVVPDYFSVTLNTFLESHQYNTCLNRKIAIDSDGYIKNCPSFSKHFGHISDTSLVDVISKSDFTKLWNINKDQVDICRDCEFRYICIDCRAYVQQPDNIYAKPAKCKYDPYTAQWAEENSTNNPLYGE